MNHLCAIRLEKAGVAGQGAVLTGVAAVKRLIALPAFAAALLLAGNAAAQPAEAPTHYRVEAEIVRPDSRSVMETTVAMPGRTEITANDGAPYVMTVELKSADHPDHSVLIEAEIARTDGAMREVVSSPRLLIRPGGTGRIEVGDEATKVFRMTISPAA